MALSNDPRLSTQECASSEIEPSSDTPLLMGLLPLYVVTAFWVYTLLLGMADFGYGLERSMALLVGASGVCMLARTRAVGPRRLILITLGVLAAALIVLRGGQGAEAFSSGRFPAIDVGQTTIAAVELLRLGENPYTADIDPIAKQVNPDGSGFRYFAGFKYGPVMTWAYTPAIAATGGRGFFATNLLALFLAAAAAAYWSFRAGGSVAAAGSVVLILVPGFISHELFVAGVNDIVPVALMLMAFAFRSRGLSALAGVALGLSFGAKLLPAALVAIPLAFAWKNKRGSFIVAALAVSALAYLPVLLDSPRELIAGLLVFNLERPIDSTSFLHFIPEALRGILRVAALATTGAILVRLAVTDKRDEAAVAGSISVAMASFFMASSAIHRNWLFWILPLMAVSVSLRLWGTHIDQKESLRRIST